MTKAESKATKKALAGFDQELGRLVGKYRAACHPLLMLGALRVHSAIIESSLLYTPTATKGQVKEEQS